MVELFNYLNQLNSSLMLSAQANGFNLSFSFDSFRMLLINYFEVDDFVLSARQQLYLGVVLQSGQVRVLASYYWNKLNDYLDVLGISLSRNSISLFN
jgi:hypothetical protein